MSMTFRFPENGSLIHLSNLSLVFKCCIQLRLIILVLKIYLLHIIILLWIALQKDVIPTTIHKKKQKNLPRSLILKKKKHLRFKSNIKEKNISHIQHIPYKSHNVSGIDLRKSKTCKYEACAEIMGL